MRDDEPAELNFDLEALARFKAGVFEPTAGELEPGHEGRSGTGASPRRVGAPATGFLNRDASR
jgi:hypothetical protein